MGQSELIPVGLADEDSSARAGQRLVDAIIKHLPEQRAVVVSLSGALGAGKTTFARGMLRGAGIEGQIRSPTYTLVETYDAPAGIQFVHVDLYRIHGTAEADGLGLREYDRPNTIWLVEWPEQAAVAPSVDIRVELLYRVPGRELRVAGLTSMGARAVLAAGFNAKSFEL